MPKLTAAHLEMLRQSQQWAIDEAKKAQVKAAIASQRALELTQSVANFTDFMLTIERGMVDGD